MTAHYIQSVRYRCNGRACGTTAIGWDDELPERWVSREVVVNGSLGGRIHETRHYCSPECVPPEPKAP